MDYGERVGNIRNQLIELGREVAVQHTTTQFPNWCLLKIGLHKVQGLPYEHAYYEGLLELKSSDEQSN
ncbi:hypothetical protein AAHB56_30880 [Bacillus thuringiensis]|uniref:hypothetical protein n=1 Tax=Bacillus basilensis TaxID=3243721 RepID=UPI001E58A9DA|nr:hypothetical protein [Bacillus sp. (in: firmicutes)]